MHGIKQKDWDYVQIAVAVILSFAFYIPVVVAGHIVPLLGMLMIPKTLAYVWIIVIGYLEMQKELKTSAIVLCNSKRAEVILPGQSADNDDGKLDDC